MEVHSSSPDRDVSMLDTPGYTDSEDPGTTASSVMGDAPDGRQRRSDLNQLRKNIIGRKHENLGESKVSSRI